VKKKIEKLKRKQETKKKKKNKKEKKKKKKKKKICTFNFLYNCGRIYVKKLLIMDYVKKLSLICYITYNIIDYIYNQRKI